MLKIGSLNLKSNLILAPMAGISDLPFRLINHKFDAELAFVEMINARSIGHKSRRTRAMLETTKEDKPLGVQLLGWEQCYLEKALEVLNEYKFDILDFNAACPAKKVVRRGEGAALLKKPKELQKILKIIVRASRVPVTVKIRSGWDKNSVNAIEVALYAQDAGINAVFVHGRTKTQEYSGKVDYNLIGRVKKALNIPVIASGDIFSAELVKKMFDETGCDAVALARGVLGNPWLFREAKEYLKEGKILTPPQPGEIIKVMLEHLNGCINFFGEAVGVMKFRKFFIWYTKGFRNIRPLRESASRTKRKVDMIRIIEGCAH
ncbi:MAG: tRNA dihydrouridine synthase DusB [Candidatus Omnitrophota bacterium]|jgi:tRNA-dihydrouridine synthase B